MFHKSTFEKYGAKFPHDRRGHVPVHVDSWRKMHFEFADMDPDEAGISPEERARRIEYLDTVWWPQVLERVRKERERLAVEHGESFIRDWERVMSQPVELPHGFAP